MKNLLYSILTLIAITGCTNNTTPSAVKTDTLADTILTDTTQNIAQPVEKTYLFQDTKLHTFSNPVKQDTFKLKVSGNATDYLNAKVTFQIISHKGKEIYNDTFDGSFLIDYGILQLTPDPANLTDEMRFDYIKKRLTTFFEEKNFKSPAVKLTTKPEEYYPDKALFEELKSNQKAVSFYYLLGKEDGKYIAYSVKRDMAILFYNCC